MDDSYFYPYLDNVKNNFEIRSYVLGSTTDEYSLSSLVRELEDQLDEISHKDYTILAHSFASVLIAKISKEYIDRAEKVVLCNWVADNKWIEKFYENHKGIDLSRYSDLKSQTIALIDSYFVNKELGKDVLEKIVYNDELFNSVQHIYGDLDLIDDFREKKDKLVSISSSDDFITTQAYIEGNCKMIGIRNFNVENAGHFPFVDSPRIFVDTLRTIISNT